MSTPAAPTSAPAVAERASLLSRLSFTFSLIALGVALSNIAAIIFLQLSRIVPPDWVITTLHVVPLADMILGALGLLLNLVETYHLVTRREDFNPKEAGREYAADDLAAILARVRPGCAARLTFPTAVVLGMISLLLSLVPLQGTDALQVHARDTLRSCASGTALTPFTFELDNSASTVSVSWSATPVEQLTPGTPWAQVQPSAGALAAGQRLEVQVIPNALICQYALAPQRAGHAFAAAPLETIYHIQVAIHGESARSVAVPGTFVGGIAFVATPTATATPTPTATATPTPTLTITSPGNNSLVLSTSLTTFTATAYDSTGHQLPGSAISWSDDIGGFLGTGSPLQAYLSGSACAPHIVHHVTASATVSAGHTLSASVTVSTYTGVVCSITAAYSGGGVGQPFTFTAAAYDDGVFQLPGPAISWSDNIDGPLGTGSPLQHPLSGGACTVTQHYVTATATDRFGDQQSTTIAVSVGYIC